MLTQELIVVFSALCIGSFGNVFLHRFPKGISVVWPDSFCPQCGHKIRWRHNIPVLGWFLLRGRCHDCGKAISPRYPLMEASFGLAAWLVLRQSGLQGIGFWYLGFFLALLLIAWVDWESMSIFDVTTVPLLLYGIAFSWAHPERFISRFDAPVSALLMLALMAGLAGLGSAWLKKDAMGGGDLKLMAAGGAFLGLQDSWKALVLGTLLSLPLTALYLFLKRQPLRRGVPVPYGSGLALGLMLCGYNALSSGGLDPAFDALGFSMLKAG
jgi:leader peptidase (prepilin peptidase)/N-methyltransferase